MRSLSIRRLRRLCWTKPGCSAGDGIVSATGNFSGNFAAANFGTDGAGSARYALVLTGAGVASGLFALDVTDTETVIDPIGQGAQILLNQSGNTITGSAGGTNYFTIQVDPATGVVTFTDNTANNLWHSNTGNPDDPQTLTLANANLLQLVQTVTDADGDMDSASINLGTGVFTIQDDGPDAVVVIRRLRRLCWTRARLLRVAMALCLRPGTSRATLRRRTSAPMVLAAHAMRWF